MALDQCLRRVDPLFILLSFALGLAVGRLVARIVLVVLLPLEQARVPHDVVAENG